MNNQIRYFDKDVWVTDVVFHYYGNELELKDIKKMSISFHVVSTVLYFLGCIFFLATLGYCYFRFDNWSYLLFLPLIFCFGMTRYSLSHYVELGIWKQDGKRIRTVVTGMHNRHWAYEVEEYLCTMTGLKMPHGSQNNSAK